MSIENAQSFYVRVTTDEEFRTQLEQTETVEERQQIIRTAGFEFTNEEWETAKEQILAASSSNEGELSDTELTAISGGKSPWGIGSGGIGGAATYGVVIGEIENLFKP